MSFLLFQLNELSACHFQLIYQLFQVLGLVKVIYLYSLHLRRVKCSKLILYGRIQLLLIDRGDAHVPRHHTGVSLHVPSVAHVLSPPLPDHANLVVAHVRAHTLDTD